MYISSIYNNESELSFNKTDYSLLLAFLLKFSTMVQSASYSCWSGIWAEILALNRLAAHESLEKMTDEKYPRKKKLNLLQHEDDEETAFHSAKTGAQEHQRMLFSIKLERQISRHKSSDTH